MNLIAHCKNCRNEISVKESVSDRAELAREKGSQFVLKCDECLKNHKYHVNDIKAKTRKSIALIAFLILLFGTALIGYTLRDYLLMPNNAYNVMAIAGMLLIPSIVYGLLTKQETDNNRRFNQYWL